jgi:hypothetical protein
MGKMAENVQCNIKVKNPNSNFQFRHKYIQCNNFTSSIYITSQTNMTTFSMASNLKNAVNGSSKGAPKTVPGSHWRHLLLS